MLLAGALEGVLAQIGEERHAQLGERLLPHPDRIPTRSQTRKRLGAWSGLTMGWDVHCVGNWKLAKWANRR